MTIQLRSVIEQAKKWPLTWGNDPSEKKSGPPKGPALETLIQEANYSPPSIC